MKTNVIKINAKRPSLKKIKFASNILKKGGVVIFPTETVYGIGANAFNAEAVRKIFEAKKRPFDNPLIVHVSSPNLVCEIAETNFLAEKLIKKFWPGPLTIILKKKSKIPSEVSAGLESVAIRMPKNNIALELIRECGFPIAAPSANISGRPSGTRVKDVVSDFDGAVECIIDGGNCEIGLESSILDLTSDVPVLLRPGKISLEELKKEIREISVPNYVLDKIVVEKPKSPGVKYKHYSPEAKVILVEGEKEKRKLKINNLEKEFLKEGKKVGKIFSDDKEKMAKNLFKKFRDFDSKKVDIILVEGVDETGIGLAIMNRLGKVAEEIVEA